MRASRESVKYDQVLRELREIVERSWRNTDEYVLHSLRSGGASTLAAGGEVLEHVIQREGRWKSQAYKTYTVNNTVDSWLVSRILRDAEKEDARLPGDGTVWGSQKKRRILRKQ